MEKEQEYTLFKNHYKYMNFSDDFIYNILEYDKIKEINMTFKLLNDDKCQLCDNKYYKELKFNRSIN